MSGHYPDGLTQDIFDRSNDMETEKILCDCGHYDIEQPDGICEECWEEKMIMETHTSGCAVHQRENCDCGWNTHFKGF